MSESTIDESLDHIHTLLDLIVHSLAEIHDILVAEDIDVGDDLGRNIDEIRRGI